MFSQQLHASSLFSTHPYSTVISSGVFFLSYMLKQQTRSSLIDVDALIITKLFTNFNNCWIMQYENEWTKIENAKQKSIINMLKIVKQQ